jgi:hypothetical protein
VQRFSVSVDEDLADWIESQADQRGVSKAKVIRDAIATARVTGLVDGDTVDPAEAGDLLDRLDALEARVAALEQTPSTGEATTGDSERQSVGIVDAFAAALADRPPRTEHGTAATVRVFALLLEDGPLTTSELRDTVYDEFADEFSDATTMWQSIQRYFDEVPGIEKVGRGTWDAAPEQLRDVANGS